MKLIIKSDSVALYDGDIQAESIKASQSSVGNIYKGRVLRLLPQMNALSVDIGTKTPAFLPVSDVSLYRQGDEIAVQAVTDARGTRGSRLTEEISVSGFYTVLIFGKTRGTAGVSKNITDDEKRLHLKGIVRKSIPKGVGSIIRTEAENAPAEDIISEIKTLLLKYESIRHDIGYYSAPRLILEAGTPERAVCRLWSGDVREFVFDSDELMQKIMENVPVNIKSNLAVRVENSESSADDCAVDVPPKRESIRLKSGGNIVIETTEALTAIDVNSGECKLSDKESTAYAVNTEAVHALSAAIRRRRTSGMIVIDFIDMEREEHRENIADALKECLSADTAKCKLFGFTNMGLFEMTRKPRR